MQLNSDGMQRFQQHLQNVLKSPCGVCGVGNWQYDDTVFELRQFAGGAVSANGMIKPIVTLTCNSCGNVLFMNALTTGIIRVNAPEASASEDGSEAKQENITPQEAASVEEAK